MPSKPQTSIISVLIADDTELARVGLSGILGTASDIQVVGCATIAEQVPQMVRQHQPNILLMDLDWFGDRGAAALGVIRQLKNESPDAKIIAVTNFTELIEKVRAAGADATISKGFSRDEILTMIRSVHAMDVSVLQTVESETLDQSLSDRELEVLTLMSQGLQDKQIAAKLQISTSTAKHHASNILAKLNVGNRAEAVAEGIKLRLIKVGQSKG